MNTKRHADLTTEDVVRILGVKRYDSEMYQEENPAGVAIGLAVGGVPGVLIAAYIVKSLPLGIVRWLVVVVVAYTATMLLRAPAAETAEDKELAQTA